MRTPAWDRDAAIARFHFEVAWMAEHGTDEAGYVATYGSQDDPGHYGDGGEKIYAADLEKMQAAEEMAVAAIMVAGPPDPR